jgi:hypothetical protein
MKYSTPFILLIIPIGLVVILLALFCFRYFDPALSFLGTLFAGAGAANAEGLVYVYAALILFVCTALIGLGLIVFIKKDDREYEQIWNTARPVCRDFSRTLASINTSIIKLQDTSERMKQCTADLYELNRQLGGGSEMRQVNGFAPETRSTTQGNSVITDLRLIHPLDALIPRGLSPFPQSHRRTWFYPHK